MSKRTNDELASSKISKIPLHRRNSTNRCKSFDQQNLIFPPLCLKTNEIIGKRMLTRLNDLESESEIILVIKFLQSQSTMCPIVHMTIWHLFARGILLETEILAVVRITTRLSKCVKIFYTISKQFHINFCKTLHLPQFLRFFPRPR